MSLTRELSGGGCQGDLFLVDNSYKSNCIRILEKHFAYEGIHCNYCNDDRLSFDT